jgi:hypothetical protein
MWTVAPSLIFTIPALVLFQKTRKYIRIIKSLKKKIVGDNFYTKHVGGNFSGDQGLLDNNLKKVIWVYQFCSFSWSNGYKFLLWLLSNTQVFYAHGLIALLYLVALTKFGNF